MRETREFKIKENEKPLDVCLHSLKIVTNLFHRINT